MEAPCSLFQLTLKFIGINLSLLDSLVGFPESIGQEIFRCSKEHGQFSLLKTNSQSRKNLQIFFEAYGASGILDGLSFDGNCLFFNDIIDDCLWLFKGLIHLDLSFCGLGDNHDALPLLISESQLKTLVLRSNLLTDDGIRRLTVQSRMFKKSSSLTCLDLSDNKTLSDRCINYFTCLENLQIVNIFNTRIVLKNKHQCWSVLDSQDICSCARLKLTFSTTGWGCDVIGQWMSQYSGVENNVSTDAGKMKLSESVTHRFYSKKKIPVTIPTFTSMPASGMREFQCLVHNTFTCPHRKCKLDSRLGSTSSRKLATIESVKPAANQDMEQAILQLYSRSSPPKKKQKQSLSLDILETYVS
ncbi:hypothetical protein Btru_029948 [Bulinus truncatus]|nr:hypothetical protein Btru_029948 [Bulinus truncatus]